MKHLYGAVNNGSKRKNNKGFTLVEMIVVLTIMAVMMGTAVWGVTGWIAHYEYISSEEKARTIYMAAQSALSAAESRGTLDEYISSLNKNGEMGKFAKKTGDTGLDKATYGIPTNPDNEDEIHEYGYLSVSQGEYASGANKALFDMLEPYVSDSEQLNASIVVEFDLTAKKVYSAFYSAWSKSIQYDATASCVGRGDFYINADRRKPEFRESFQVGYYGADQVNVVKLENLPQLKVDCMLHNKETLYLTMNSDDENAEEFVKYKVDIYEDPKTIISTGGLLEMMGDPLGAPDDGNENGSGNPAGSDSQKLLCSLSFDKSILGYSNTDNDIPKRVELNVSDALGNDLGPYPFILSFRKYKDENGKDQEEFSLVLDALMTGQSMALLDDIDKLTGRTDKSGYSITRLIGTNPVNICAKVSVEPTMAGVYSSGSSKMSNTENSLFGSKVKEYKDNKYFNDDNAYLIVNNRHFANIRYTENYTATEDKGFTYGFTGDIDWKDAVIYDTFNASSADIAYKPVDMSKNPIDFPMITKLGVSSIIDGDGNQYSNFTIGNSGGVSYAHVGGSVANDNVTGKPVNMAKSLGIIGVNQGKIRRLIIVNAILNALSYEDYSKTSEAAGISEATKRAVYSDSLEAVGILCGRNEGSIREIYFDNKCEVKATVFANLNDSDEAKTYGMSDADIANDKYLNEKYGCGVGMAAGTVVLKNNAVIDRICTAGKVEAMIKGSGTDFKEAPAVSDYDARRNIYKDTPEAGETYSNAQYYAYGVGGTFGYVYGKYDKDAQRLGIGVNRAEVEANNNLNSDDDNYYLPMYNRVSTKKTITDENGNDKEITVLVKGSELLFATDENRSIVNKADITSVSKTDATDGSSFTGGIAGNIFLAGLNDNTTIEKDDEDDVSIPEKAKTQLINCHNYGDTTGLDFVGGVTGVNGEGGYIAECASFGSPSATKGVSAGITSENYGYIRDCLVDRALADEDNENKPYVPVVKGNMVVAGAITSVNHEDCVVKDCRCAIADIKDDNGDSIDTPLKITGNEMDTFGYLVGENFGVVNGGKAGEFVGFESKKTKMIIGGAVGTNREVVKNVSVTAILVDRGEAECIGGITGLNLDTVKTSKFGGSIKKNKSVSRDTTVGGIAGRNGDGKESGTITGCYIIGANFEVSGICNYVESDSETSKLAKSSAVGGISGINYPSSTIEKCYITSLGEANSSGNAVFVSEYNTYKVKKQSKIVVKNGMVGGVAAINYGNISKCGYTGKVFYEKEDDFAVCKDTSSVKDILVYEDSKSYLGRMKTPDGSDNDGIRKAVEELNDMYVTDTGELADDIEAACGYLTNDEDKYQYALPKKETTDGSITHAAYKDDTNTFVLTLDQGKGCIGGIAGYNAASGSIKECASGRWLVENYLPRVTYSTVGGLIGTNSAEGTKVSNLINLAYVRMELPIIETAALDANGQATDKAPDNRFYYVGGIIGTQNNTTSSGWTIEKCINAGTVINYYGNNVGGVLGQVSGMGGKVQYCYNYGTLMAGYTTVRDGSNSGTAGGIVSHYTKLQADQINEVIYCQNHGIVAFPMQGTDKRNSYVHDATGGLTSNDVGGIVGEISAPVSTSLYTVNIKDCVNGKNAKLYCASKCAGIIGQIGCFTKGNVSSMVAVNSVFVNIDSCRNYCSDMWSGFRSCVPGKYLMMTGGGITAGRDAYSANSKITGYTTIRNCLSVRMNGNYTSGNNVGNFAGKATENNNGILAFAKQNSPMSTNPLLQTLKYCGNNFYLDESSFQYSDKRGLITANGYNPNATKPDGIVKGASSKINALVAEGEPSDKKTIAKSNKVEIFKNTVNDLSLYMDDFNRQRLASERIVSVEYGSSGSGKYALFVEPLGYSVDKLNNKNAWIKDGYIHINTETEGEIVKPLVYYQDFSETGSVTPYSTNLLNHFNLERIKRYDDFRSQAESEEGTSLSGKIDSSRIPFADEYDLDYYNLDNDFMKYIDKYKAVGPDTVENVDVRKDDTYGYYDVTWNVRGENGKNPSATEFDVEARYVELEPGVTFNFDDLDTYLSNNVVMTENKTAYGTTTTLVPPKTLVMKEGYTYYAVVRVKDARGQDTNYSIIENREAVTDPDTGDVIKPAVKSYVQLEPKLPMPEFEIVKYTTKKKDGSYESKWMLHLKNAADFVSYTGIEDFEVGAYSLKAGSQNVVDKKVKMTRDNIVDAGGNLLTGELLNHAVDAMAFATDKMDYELYGYAKAKDCLDADLYKFSVYVPSKANPDMDYTWTPVDDEKLNNPEKKPEYTGTLTYNQFDRKTSTLIPPTAQTFKLELYGIREEKNEFGEITRKWHETVASKEYSVEVGETIEDINIGYYDVPSNVNLASYDSFGVDLWYAASGQGDVYNYFETTSERADKTVRSSGYITDHSSGETKYYFHTAKLNNPVVKLICMGRNPEWYAVLCNGDDYAPGTRITLNGTGDSNVIIDTANPRSTGNLAVDKLFKYASRVGDGNYERWFMAKMDGCVDSDRVYLSPSKGKVYVPAENHLRNNLYVNLGVTCDKYTDDEGIESKGSFTLSADNKLNFKGTISYSSHDSVWQYFRYEIFARDENEQQVTLYLSDDVRMEKGRGADNGYKNTVSVSIPPIEIPVIKDADNKDINKYHDFRFAVWYSKSEVSSNVADEGYYIYQYDELPESVVKSFDCYDKDKDIFNDARANGLIIDVSGIDPENGITKPVYYYATPLADNTYGDNTYTNGYKNYVLYRELEDTVTFIKKKADGTDDISVTDGSIKYVTWSMYPNYYGTENECDINIKVYQYPKSEAAPVLGTLNQDYLFYEAQEKGTSPYRVDASDDYTFDWQTYNYYAAVKVKDASVLNDNAYSDSVLVAMAKPLATPKLSLSLLGWNGDFIRLDNPEDYEGCTGDVEIVVTYAAYPDKTFTIDVNGDNPTWGITAQSKVPITYSYPKRMDKHQIKDGSTFKFEGYAVEKDKTTGEIVNTSAKKFSKNIYTPNGGNPAPDGTKISLSNTSVSVNDDKSSVTFKSDIEFTCTASFAPKDEQGFYVALIGTPKTNVNGSKQKVIISRTDNKGLTLMPNSKVTGKEYTFDLADDVNLDDFKDLNIYIWYGDYGADGYVYSQYELTGAVFEQYKDKAGVVVDCTDGISNAKYFFVRVFGYKDEVPSTNGATRGSVRYEFTY